MTKIFDQIQESDYVIIIQWIIEHIGAKENFFLTGDLGAGKTTFVRMFSEILNVHNLVTSPSFTIMNLYQYPEGKIYHLDLYRLNTEEEASEIGLEEILNEPEIKFIEWGNRFPSFLKNGYFINFHLNDDFTRKIVIQKI